MIRVKMNKTLLLICSELLGSYPIRGNIKEGLPGG
jgi:hypothetical protein